MDTERFRYEGEEVALLVSGPADAGVRFLTGSEQGHQVGVMRHREGHIVAPHTHPATERTADGRPETLMVIDGVMRAVLTVDGEQVMDEQLQPGDALLVIDGELTVTAEGEAEYVRVSSR